MRYNQGWGWKGGGGGGGEKRGWGEKGEKREADMDRNLHNAIYDGAIYDGAIYDGTHICRFIFPSPLLLSLPLPLISLLPPLSPHPPPPPPPPPPLFSCALIHGSYHVHWRERAVQCLLNWMVSATPSL